MRRSMGIERATAIAKKGRRMRKIARLRRLRSAKFLGDLCGVDRHDWLDSLNKPVFK